MFAENLGYSEQETVADVGPVDIGTTSLARVSAGEVRSTLSCATRRESSGRSPSPIVSHGRVGFTTKTIFYKPPWSQPEKPELKRA
jgi:hypothetical protein